MKKHVTILLFSILALSSCGNVSRNDTNSILKNNITTFSKGFSMLGEIIQTRIQATGYDQDGNYTFSTSKETNTYQTQIGFENLNRNGFTKLSTQDYENVTYTIEDYTYFEDENGFAYKESLNHKNQLERDYKINQSTSSFAYNGFYNFFSIINVDDLKENEENDARFDLDLDKAAIITNNLLYSLNSGFATSVKEAYFTLNGSFFSSFDITMNDYYYVDSTSTDENLYKIENTASFVFSDVGTYKIDSAKVYENKGYTSLEKAFKSIDDNFTMHVKMDYFNQMTSSKKDPTYQDFYFTGEKIYVHSYSDISKSSPDYSQDYYLAPDSDGTLYSYIYDETSSSFVKGKTAEFPSLYQGKFTYEDYLPCIKEVSSDLFVQDEDSSDTYKAEEDAIETLTSCFYLQKVPYKKSASASFIDVKVVLDEDAISSVILPYSYTDFQEASLITGSYEISFSDIGKTEIPTL